MPGTTPIDRELFRAGQLDRARSEKALAIISGEGLSAPPGRIAFLAGAGVEHADAAAILKEVAERFSIPVATTLRAKGVFPEDHPLSLGVFGYAGTRHATAALLSEDLDLLIVLGSGLNERDTMHWSGRLAPRAGMIGVNTSTRALVETMRGGFGILGDVGAFLTLLDEFGAAALDEGVAARKEWIAAIRKGARLHDTDNLVSDAVPIHPARVDPGAAERIAARRHRAGRFRGAPGLRRALLGGLRAAHLHLGHQSRADGLGGPGGGRRRLRAAGKARRRHHRRRLHADAWHRDRGGGALRPADHLCRPQQRGARQCVAPRTQAWAAAGGADDDSGS